jgi:Immunity protein 17
MKMGSEPATIFALAAGIFVIVAAASDWNWFFEHPRAKFFVDAFGRKGARIFYGVLGCAFLLIGLYCRRFQT